MRRPVRSAVLAWATLVCACATADVGELSWRIPDRSKPYVNKSGSLISAHIPRGVSNVCAYATADIDLSGWAQSVLEAEIRCKAEAVDAFPRPGRGIKLSLSYRNPETGKRCYQSARVQESGSFGWTNLHLTVSFGEVPPLERSAQLVIGLQESAGTAVFDLSTFQLRKASPVYPLSDNDYRVSYPARVQAFPRQRGVMGRGVCRNTERDIEDLRRMGATLVRLQMNGFGEKKIGATPRPMAEWDAWLAKNLGHAHEVLGWLEARGMKMALDLHCPPVGSYGNYCRTFYVRDYADRFISAWREIARRFKGRKGIYGYDLMNEPNQQERALPDCDYWNLQRRAAEAIREIDPDATIIFSANQWDGPSGYEWMRALEMDNVIYQVHVYSPSAFTHQAVNGIHAGDNRVLQPYPNADKGWNKEFLRRQLRFVRAFQLRHHARIFVGEFSASAFAPGAETYLADCIDLFEEYGWDWTYHSFREAPCWNLECAVNPQTHELVPSVDTPRLRAVISGFHRGRLCEAAFP